MSSFDCSADLVDLLETAGIGLTTGTNLFQGPMPEAESVDVPAQAVAVLLTGGPPPEPYIGQGAKVRRLVTCQVRVRSNREDFQSGQTLALRVIDALTLPSVIGYTFIRTRESAPVYWGTDGAGRHLWSLNVELLYTSSPSA